VTAFWRALGLPGLIDVHTHFMPANVLAKVWAYFDGDRGRSGHAWPIAYRLPEEDRLALLRQFGVRRFDALLYPHKPDMAAWLNAWAAVSPPAPPMLCTVAPSFPSLKRPITSRPRSRGARLFKAHVQGRRVTTPRRTA
jgi:hypothetical protein